MVKSCRDGENGGLEVLSSESLRPPKLEPEMDEMGEPRLTWLGSVEYVGWRWGAGDVSSLVMGGTTPPGICMIALGGIPLAS